MTAKCLKVVQVLPELNSGGVERGTIEFARELVKLGHQSIVISNGGRQVNKLEAEGSTHIQMPVHKKSLMSLRQVRLMRQQLLALKPDIVHVRSRVPAWIVWLAWRKLPKESRPKLISTFHGLYSVNFYSAVMARAERIIAISDCVHEYILKNYSVSPNKITRIYRGVDPESFNKIASLDAWKDALYAEHPELKNKRIILMPGRLTRWKGQEAFINMMRLLVDANPDFHGVIVGEADPIKEHYKTELLGLCEAKQLQDSISFLGHRSDIQNLYQLAEVTCHMSNKPEPFGRTVPEALAVGCKVVAFDRGGASESMKDAYPQGLVESDNIELFAKKIIELSEDNTDIRLPDAFYLSYQVQETLSVYELALVEQ
ncbi:glycosyltransferase family 4 protein [Litoribacillus peritrichatus]|uniref:Glycosyltransferase family 4 protein n=1 Tax=Litoribacillus peritrichatus TaxID=718191 RepID=A0ABP7MMV6_9GAMM